MWTEFKGISCKDSKVKFIIINDDKKEIEKIFEKVIFTCESEKDYITLCEKIGEYLYVSEIIKKSYINKYTALHPVFVDKNVTISQCNPLVENLGYNDDIVHLHIKDNLYCQKKYCNNKMYTNYFNDDEYKNINGKIVYKELSNIFNQTSDKNELYKYIIKILEINKLYK